MKIITKAIQFASAALLACGVGSASAAIVNIDLGSAVSGTLINGVGGSFAQTFAGQTVSGNAVVGSPTGPLTLAPSGSIEVAYWNGSNSLLPQPGNVAPLSLLLDGPADSLSWTMGYGNGGSIEALLFGASGNLIDSILFSGLSGYSTFNISGHGIFSGVTFTNNTDAAGLRFQDFSYNSVTPPVPEPETYAMLLVGLCLVGFMTRRRKEFDFSA